MGPGFDRPDATRDGRKIVYPVDKKTMPGPETIYGSIGPAWANVANTPLRYWKMESFEGGVRTPLVAYWPKGIGQIGGAIVYRQASLIDIMPTIVEVSGAKYPAISPWACDHAYARRQRGRCISRKDFGR